MRTNEYFKKVAIQADKANHEHTTTEKKQLRQYKLILRPGECKAFLENEKSTKSLGAFLELFLKKNFEGSSSAHVATTHRHLDEKQSASCK